MFQGNIRIWKKYLDILDNKYLGTDHLTSRGGGYVFFSKKIFWFPMMLKKIFWFWWREKKIIWFRVFVIKSNVNIWRKFRALRDKKNNILTIVLSEKKILNETKNHNPPFKLNGRSLTRMFCVNTSLCQKHFDKLAWATF